MEKWGSKNLSCCIKNEKYWFHFYCWVGSFMIVADSLNNDIEDSRKNKISFYKNLFDKNGKVYPRWNSTCKDDDGISIIRKHLLIMSNSSCAYCGKKIGNSSLDVDHYLPLKQFPYIAYCWYNLIVIIMNTQIITSSFNNCSFCF